MVKASTGSSQPQTELKQTPFPIVGIGASAGGLEAFTQLLTDLPATTGMAYIYVQHLDPTHESLLTVILSRVTTMPVSEARDALVVEPDHVYVMVPNTNLTISHGILTLLPRLLTDGQHLSIDTFLRSLAADRQQQAIGVLLSGTASDGTLGFEAIKQAGGITFAQDPLSAKYAMMPQNAIAAGYVDMVLPPAAIARELGARSLASQAHILQAVTPAVLETQAQGEQEERALIEILYLVRRATRVDFLLYKRPTVKRRLHRRMALHKLERYGDYLLLLQENATEVQDLYQDLLITVTSFFRDPAAFGALKHTVFQGLLQDRVPEEPIRAWVMGCSTGEEVYSLAICLIEFLDEVAASTPFLLFATDLKETVIQKARVGIYSSHAMHTVSPERLSRFFTPVENGYQISKTIRERCVFALHNVFRDPPFSRLDLVSCRNVFIYLQPVLQQKIMQTLHYALKPKGYLMLGTSETVGIDTTLFSRIDAKNKLYMKKNTHPRFPFDITIGRDKIDTEIDESRGKNMQEESDIRGQREADQVLLAHYVPASVVVDADMEILQFRGHTSPYLEPAPGKASFNLLKMARNGLGLGLRSAIHEAAKGGHPVTKTGLHVTFADRVREVTVEVIPLKAMPGERLYLIVFTDTPPRSLAENELATENQSSAQTGKRRSQDRRVTALERELVTTRAEMKAMLEDREAANEELQAANEEILSSNEELQSLNEELETTQEEIQATNEELTTLNQELSLRNDQLKVARDYADAIIETVREPLIVLNADLCVMRANAAFYQTFHTTAKETEQHYLYNLQHGQWKNEQLRVLLEEILPENHAFQDFELDATFPTIGHRTMLLNARRIVHEQERDHLILLAFEDITERKELEAQKDAFLGMVSHELKTPVTSIKAYTQLLQKRLTQQGDEPSAKSLSKINTQLDKLTTLINDLLDVTRVETGNLQIYPAAFAVDDLVREIVEEMQLTTKTHHISIKETAQQQVYGDRERIGQVLTNLLSNAIKYSPQAEKIQVRAMANEEVGDAGNSGDAECVVTVSVQDSGIGISQEKQEQIFQRFYRVEGPTQKTISGLGLGLYISNEIIKQLGGHMSVESSPGEGSTFFFTIPCTKSKQE